MYTFLLLLLLFFYFFYFLFFVVGPGAQDICSLQRNIHFFFVIVCVSAGVFSLFFMNRMARIEGPSRAIKLVSLSR